MDDRGSIQRDFEPREARDEGSERGGKRRALDRELSSSRRDEGRSYHYSHSASSYSHQRVGQDDSWRRSERDESSERRRSVEEENRNEHGLASR